MARVDSGVSSELHWWLGSGLMGSAICLGMGLGLDLGNYGFGVQGLTKG